MSRVRVMSAMAHDLASFEEHGYNDPTITVRGELPAAARPFEIARVYKGAHGHYEEALALAEPDGTIIYESAPRVIQLRGEMFEDLFRTQVRDRIEISDVAEHTLAIYLDGGLVARVPVFVDAPDSVHGAGVFTEAADAALKKSAVCWLTIPQPDGSTVVRPAWYVQQGGSIYVLTGDGEQQLPGLAEAERVTVTIKSKDVKATIGTTEADVRVVTDGDEFERIASMGLGARLNLTDGDRALQRWKDTCVMAELTPRD